MTANKGNQKKKAAQKPVRDIEAAEPVEETAEVVGFEKDGEVRQAREKAKGKNQSAFVAWIKKADPIAMACFIAIILASCVILGSYINHAYFGPHHSPTVAGEGSTVEVEYVGSYIGYYDQDGSVIFDTNIKSVAEDSDRLFSAAYSHGSSYNNLSFTVGGTSVLKDFGDAVVGHSKGQVVRVAIPASDDAYGRVDTHTNADKTITLQKQGTITLAQLNKACGTNYKSSSFPLSTGGPIAGIDFMAQYNSDDDITYTFVTVTDGDYTLAANDLAVHVINVDADKFTLTYNFANNGVYYGIYQGDSGFEPVFLEYRGDAGFKYWFNDLSEKAEQKGEKMYFYIKIKSVN